MAVLGDRLDVTVSETYTTTEWIANGDTANATTFNRPLNDVSNFINEYAVAVEAALGTAGTDLSDHAALTNGTHGLTGATNVIVGTEEVQAITNKTKIEVDKLILDWQTISTTATYDLILQPSTYKVTAEADMFHLYRSTATGSVLTIGGALTVPGVANIMGGGAGEASGKLKIFNGADTDGTTEHFQLQANDTNLEISTEDGLAATISNTGEYSGNAATATSAGTATTATTLASSQDFSITGDVTANAISFNGSGGVALSTTYSGQLSTSLLKTAGGDSYATTKGNTTTDGWTLAPGSSGDEIYAHIYGGYGVTAGRGTTSCQIRLLDFSQGNFSQTLDLTFTDALLQTFAGIGTDTITYKEIAGAVMHKVGSQAYCHVLFKLKYNNGTNYTGALMKLVFEVPQGLGVNLTTLAGNTSEWARQWIQTFTDTSPLANDWLDSCFLISCENSVVYGSIAEPNPALPAIDSAAVVASRDLSVTSTTINWEGDTVPINRDNTEFFVTTSKHSARVASTNIQIYDGGPGYNTAKGTISSSNFSSMAMMLYRGSATDSLLAIGRAATNQVDIYRLGASPTLLYTINKPSTGIFVSGFGRKVSFDYVTRKLYIGAYEWPGEGSDDDAFGAVFIYDVYKGVLLEVLTPINLDPKTCAFGNSFGAYDDEFLIAQTDPGILGVVQYRYKPHMVTTLDRI